MEPLNGPRSQPLAFIAPNMSSAQGRGLKRDLNFDGGSLHILICAGWYRSCRPRRAFSGLRTQVSRRCCGRVNHFDLVCAVLCSVLAFGHELFVLLAVDALGVGFL